MIGGYIGGIGTVPYVGDGITAILSVTEDSDTLTSAAVIALVATAAITETDDTLSSSAVLAIVAAASIIEDDDTLDALGELEILAALGGLEDDDSLVAMLSMVDLRLTTVRPKPGVITSAMVAASQITAARTTHVQITA